MSAAMVSKIMSMPPHPSLTLISKKTQGAYLTTLVHYSTRHCTSYVQISCQPVQRRTGTREVFKIGS